MTRRFVDDEGQVTPHGDALSESEVAQSLAGAGTAASRDERGFTRDKTDVDVGQDEFFRFMLARRAAISSDLDAVLASVQATRAQNNAVTDNYGQLANAFWHSLAQSNGTFNNSLVQNESIETDNEVISTTVLAEMVKALADEVAALKK